MSEEKEEKVYVLPATYEEGVARKQAVLEMINKYNEALFAGGELPYTDEEIDALQEEYEILDSRLKLTKEEKLQKLDDSKKVVNEDGTIEKKVYAIDKVHWSIFIYPLILLFFASGIVTSQWAQTWMMNYIDKIHAIAYNNDVYYTSFSDSQYMFNGFGFYFRMIFYLAAIPLGVSILALVIHLLFKKFRPENAKITFIIFLVVLAVAVIMIVVMFFAKLNPNVGPYYTNADNGYYSYYYQKIIEEYYSQYGY